MLGETVTAIGGGGVMVTLAVANLVESAALVAVIVAVVSVETASAVYKPLVLIVPTEAVQLTDELLALFTVAENFWEAEDAMVTLSGLILTDTTTAALTVTLAEACLVGSTTLVAVMVTAVSAVTAGALYSPLFEIVPFDALQFTLKSLVLVTAAANCCVPPEASVTRDGDTETATGLPGSGMASCTERLNFALDLLTPAPSTTITSKLKLPASEGLPEIIPVSVRDNPAGI